MRSTFCEYITEKIDSNNRPDIVVHDSERQGVWAIAADNKGETEGVLRRVCDIIKLLPYMKIVPKSHQEPSIAEVDREATNRVYRIVRSITANADMTGGCQVVVQRSLAGESAANGAAENATQRAQGQPTTIKLDLEAAAGIRTNPSSPAWAWLIELAARTILIWKICGDDGSTATHGVRGRSRTSPKARFGENVLYRVAETVRPGKSEARWGEGIRLGTLESSDAHLVGTRSGVIKCRCTSGTADNFDAHVIEEICGNPLHRRQSHRRDAWQPLAAIHEAHRHQCPGEHR